MYFELLNVFYNFMNRLFFAAKITKSNFLIGVFYIFRNWRLALVLFFYWVLVTKGHEPITKLNEIFHFGIGIFAILWKSKVGSTHLLVSTSWAEFFTIV
jgi:hypothetical protein